MKSLVFNFITGLVIMVVSTVIMAVLAYFLLESGTEKEVSEGMPIFIVVCIAWCTTATYAVCVMTSLADNPFLAELD